MEQTSVQTMPSGDTALRTENGHRHGPAAQPAGGHAPLPGAAGSPAGQPGHAGQDAPPSAPGAEGQEGPGALQPTEADYAFDLPPHFTVDNAVADRFRALCAEQGLTPGQAQAAVAFYVAENEAAGGIAADTCEGDLRTLWKGRYGERLDAAKRAVRTLDARMEGRLAPLVRAGLGNNPAFAELMALVGDRMGEDSLGGPGSPAGGRAEALSTEDFLRTVVFAKR